MQFELLSAETVDAAQWDQALLAANGNPTQLAHFGQLGGRRRQPVYVVGTGQDCQLRWLVYRYDPLPAMCIVEARSEPFGIGMTPEHVAGAVAALRAALRPIRVRIYDMVFCRHPEPTAIELAGLTPAPAFGSMVLDLTLGADALRSNLDKKLRNRVNKAERAGLTLEEDATDDGVARFHAALAQTMARTGGPMIDRQFLRSAVRELAGAGHLRLFIARCDGRDVGASIELLTPQRALGWLAGTMDDAPTGTSNWMQWDIIRRFADEGVASYDLGGIDLAATEGSKGDGILRAKRKFGGQTVRYYGGTSNDQPLRAWLYDRLEGTRKRLRR